MRLLSFDNIITIFHHPLPSPRLFITHLIYLSDKNELLAARTYLEQAALNNLPEFLKALSDVLVHQTNSVVARTASGLQLKNHLTSKDPTLSEQYRQRWLSFTEECREYIKKNVSNYILIFLSVLFLYVHRLFTDPRLAGHRKHETIVGSAVRRLCGCRRATSQPMELSDIDAGQQGRFGNVNGNAPGSGTRSYR